MLFVALDRIVAGPPHTETPKNGASESETKNEEREQKSHHKQFASWLPSSSINLTYTHAHIVFTMSSSSSYRHTQKKPTLVR